MPSSTVNLKNRGLAALLAFLVPGLGHFYQGRRGKGALYLVCILGLYLFGFVLGGGRNVYWSWVNPLQNPDSFRLYFVGQFWIGLAAFPALIQATLIHYGKLPILDGWMAAPYLDPSMSGPLREVIGRVGSRGNEMFTRLGGKLVEVGTLYTTIAGMLNILAIYDAYDGPAHTEEVGGAEAAAREKAPTLVAGGATE